MRSVACDPGRRLLMFTPFAATCRAVPATKPVSPVRAAFDRPSAGIGALTDCEVMLTTRPQPRSIMPGRIAVISAMGVSMLASSALMKSSRPQSDQRPRRRAARVGHEDVDITRRRQDLRAALVAGDIGGDRRHRHAIGVADMLRRRLQRLRPAGVHHQIDARLRQRFGAAPAKPLRRRADQRAFSLDTQIHASLPFVFRTKR
jgi:hypothetical protein